MPDLAKSMMKVTVQIWAMYRVKKKPISKISTGREKNDSLMAQLPGNVSETCYIMYQQV